MKKVGLSWLKEKLFFLFEEHILYFPLKFYYLRSWLRTKDKITVLCYPEKPEYYHAIYQICRYSGFSITNKLKNADVVIHFEDTTYRKYDNALLSLGKEFHIVNYRCTDISKIKVDEFHREVFGYSLSIDPQVFTGKYVKKGNINSLHDGVILDKPEAPCEGYVYQLLVDNEVNGELLEIRVPIIGGKMPFVYFKHIAISSRFKSENKIVEVLKPDLVMSVDEQNKILQFCERMGLDCGELDVLRDSRTKKLYIVDANNTPASPPYNLSWAEFIKALDIMSSAFKEAFLENTSKPSAFV